MQVLAIRARSRPIFRRCSIFIRHTQAELTPSSSRPIMTGENSANVALNSLMRRRNFRQPSFVLRLFIQSSTTRYRKCKIISVRVCVLYFKFLERDGNRVLSLLPLNSLDWTGLKDACSNVRFSINKSITSNINVTAI